MAFSEGFDIDLQDPVLLRDVELDLKKVEFLRERAVSCFLCKWILEDYEKNKTLTGVKRDGQMGAYEMMPIRGEINHVWLELYQKPYPFKRKVIKEETEITPFPMVPASIPLALPKAAHAPEAAPAPTPAVQSAHNIPISKPVRRT